MKQTSVSQFVPSQIVSLEHENNYLYCEVIQVVAERKLCWVRPLVLAVASVESDFTEIKELVDLRMTSDLFWPVELFRPAIDTEVIPLLMQLEAGNCTSHDEKKARQQLHHFIDRFWQARSV